MLQPSRQEPLITIHWALLSGGAFFSPKPGSWARVHTRSAAPWLTTAAQSWPADSTREMAEVKRDMNCRAVSPSSRQESMFSEDQVCSSAT